MANLLLVSFPWPLGAPTMHPCAMINTTQKWDHANDRMHLPFAQWVRDGHMHSCIVAKDHHRNKSQWGIPKVSVPPQKQTYPGLFQYRVQTS